MRAGSSLGSRGDRNTWRVAALPFQEARKCQGLSGVRGMQWEAACGFQSNGVVRSGWLVGLQSSRTRASTARRGCSEPVVRFHVVLYLLFEFGCGTLSSERTTPVEMLARLVPDGLSTR